MTSEKVSPLKPDVNLTVDDALQWAKEAKSRNLINPKTAQNCIVALRHLASVIQPDEPKSPAWVLENLQELSVRYGHKSPTTEDTLKTYRSRARTILTWYGQHRRGQFRASTAKKTGAKKPAEKKVAANKKVEPEAERAASARQQPTWSELPLPNDRVLRFELPADFTVDDLKRFFIHAMPMCSDFDFGNPAHAGAFSGALVTQGS